MGSNMEVAGLRRRVAHSRSHLARSRNRLHSFSGKLTRSRLRPATAGTTAWQAGWALTRSSGGLTAHRAVATGSRNRFTRSRCEVAGSKNGLSRSRNGLLGSRKGGGVPIARRKWGNYQDTCGLRWWSNGCWDRVAISSTRREWNCNRSRSRRGRALCSRRSKAPPTFRR